MTVRPSNHSLAPGRRGEGAGGAAPAHPHKPQGKHRPTHLDGVFDEDHSLVQAQIPPGRGACGQRGRGEQEMARVNVEILVISKIKWTGIGEFNSNDHYIYYCGKESLRRNGVAIRVNTGVPNAVLGCNLKNDRMICSFPRQNIQYHGCCYCCC